MNIFFLFLVVILFPINSFADQAKGPQAGFYSYCVASVNRTDVFCKCAQEHGVEPVVQKPKVLLERKMVMARGHLDRLSKHLLNDSSMTMERINVVCDVADEYYAMIQEFPLMENGSVSRSQLTAEQRISLKEKSGAITDRALAVHDKYGSTQGTKSLLNGYSSAYCLERYNLAKMKKEYDSLDIMGAEIDYGLVIRLVSTARGQCRGL